MLRFFRNIRQKLLENGNFRKYFWYAFGEILLVMIGILLALQVSNWNENRKEQNRLANYYERIIEEIESDIPEKQAFLLRNQQIINLNKRSLSLIATGRTDSLELLKFTLGALSTAWSSTLSYPVLDEFKSSGYLSKVQNTELKERFFQLNASIKSTSGLEAYLVDQYLNIIEPFIIKSFNYQEVALDSYQQLLVVGGPKIDYIELGKNIELWNHITLKLETSEIYTSYIENLIEDQQELMALLNNELE